MNRLDGATLERWCDSRDTSLDVGRAIFEIADSDDDAARIWQEPTEAEISKVDCLAWQYADEDTDTLYWGGTALHRKNEAA